MTKGTLIDLILLGVTGGKLSVDNNVWRDDIAAYLPAAVAEAVKRDAFEKRAEARQDLALTGLFEFFWPVEFFKEVIATPVKDTVSDKYYIELPALLDLPNGWNVGSARPVGTFDVDYIRLPGFQSAIGLQDIGQTFYWVSNRAGKFRAYFSSLPFPIQDVAVLAAVSPSDLDDGDEVPIPPGMENYVIQTAVRHFTGQATMPADAILDDKGINEQPVQTGRR